MDGTIHQWLGAMSAERDRAALRPVLTAIAHCLSTQTLTSAGLVIKAGASPVVKTGASAFYASARGTLVTKPASTDLPALVGTVPNAMFNVFAFFIDMNGTLTSAMGTAGTTLARVKFPPIPGAQAIVGFIIVNPTGTGSFVGGTTALDDATVVPNVAYISPVGQFDPTILVTV